MRQKSVLFSLVILTMAATCVNARGQWVEGTMPSGGPSNCFAVYGSNPPMLFAGTGGGIFLSTDSGISWTAPDTGLPLNSYINALAANRASTSPAMIFANLENYDYNNIFLSINNGSSWRPKTILYRWFDTVQTTIDTFVDAPSVTALALGAGNASLPVLYAGTQDNGGFFLSTDTGTTWVPAHNGLPAGSVATAIAAVTDTSGNNKLFLGLQNKGVFLSTDNGASWMEKDSGLTSDVNAFAVCDSNASFPKLFAATNNGIFFSSDNGNSWKEVNAGLSDLHVLTLAAVNYGASLSVLVAGTQDSGIFLSTNYGSSWTSANDGFPPNTIVSAFAEDYSSNSTPILYAAADGSVWRRPVYEMVSPGALTAIPNPLSFGNVIVGKDSTRSLYIRNTGNIAVSIASIDFVASGVVFARSSIALPAILQPLDSVRCDITFSPNLVGTYYDTLAVSSDAKRLEVPLEGFGVENSDVAGTHPFLTALEPYPNPCSRSTTISFTIPMQEPIQISIVNLLGVPVAKLVDGEQSAGTHSVTWDASTAAPGSYWCIVRAANRMEKIALLVQR